MAHTKAAAPRGASPELIERSVAVIVAQARAGVGTALMMAALYGVILVPSAGWLRFLAWYVVFAAGMLARQRYFNAVVARHGPTEWALRRIAVAAAVTGWFVTTCVPLFSSFLSTTDIGVLTMITVAWVSLAVSMLAVQPRIYTVYLVACLATMYLGLARYASTQDMVVILLAMCIGAPMMVRLARTLNQQLREIVDGAQEKAQVVEQLRQSLKNQQETQRARSRFLGAASHDLRQPVQALLFLSDIFRKSGDPARRDQMAQQIVRTGQSIDGMFRHLVDFAQIDAGTMKAVVQPVQLERLIASASSGFAEKCAARGLRFRTEIRGPCTVSADPVLLERMLRNFLDNAFKYSLQGEIVLRADCSGVQAVVSVCDQGVGMDPEDLEQACNAFYRGRSAAKAEAEGIGLGLAISRHMADLMHATLEIESQPGQGTRVTMRLPVVQEAAPARVSAVGEPRAAPLQGLLVAVLENDRLAREALAAWLQDAGARVIACAVLAELQQALEAAAEAPDFLLADYRLADGTGMDAVQALRGRFGTLPAMIVSGEPDIRERGLPVPVLQKPVAPELLLEAMQAALAKPQALALDAPS
ncbi:MAG TPA: hybrid sensor histidine kinase/response regulator [Ramlibacter sp.]|uniref:hybrid sensor histidine kinase/response regulator n=1 Tax=Ramlibacter sp. TaxID=1917967 RepID=UPI002D80DAE5|nr:hybrid sensor histidine kinase/response regulator [Ramlibacter sp.]HET8745720.1 hybrid sensor histidine kinase/response regulator [Ramlibacter sp.]